MSSVVEPQARVQSADANFISDVLHKLSQPITALQCSLELALERDQTCAEFRASIQAAVQNAERLRQSLLLLRELSDADDPGDVSAPVDLQALLYEVQQDFLPVCQSSGGCFTLRCDPVHVRGHVAKLRRAMFYLLEYLLRHSRCRSVDVKVMSLAERKVEITMIFSGARSSLASTPEAPDSTSTGELEIARRSFRAVGGELAMVEDSERLTSCIARLLLAE